VAEWTPVKTNFQAVSSTSVTDCSGEFDGMGVDDEPKFVFSQNYSVSNYTFYFQAQDSWSDTLKW